MTKKLIIIFAAMLLMAVLLGYFYLTREIAAAGKSFSILIKPDENASDLKAKLTDAGIDLNGRFFSLLLVIKGVDKKIYPGRYNFEGPFDHLKLVAIFARGEVTTSKVTIPEGLPLWEVVPILAREVPTDSLRLARLVYDTTFPRQLGIDAPDFEGYLFPETYTFFADDQPENVIEQMVMLFMSNYADSLRQRTTELGMSMHEVVTLASMIEAEAADGAERDLIASVFHNRLRRGMLLQCDPTVIYALGGLERPLWKRDLDVDSPYNTYRHSGLPPGPICSPGLASIRAALYPAESNYLYFVADGKGKHIFSATLKRHNRAIRQVKAARKRSGGKR